MLASLFIYGTSLFAQKEMVPDKPNPPRLYNDLSAKGNFLSKEEAASLERKLYEFDDSTSNQIAVVIVDDLNGLDASQFATELGHKWGIGQAKQDNGVVVLISLGGAAGNRDLNISVGYGLEGAIPDLMTKRIQEEVLIPNLKAGRYYEALDESTSILMALAKGEYNENSFKKPTKLKPKTIFLIILIIVMIILFSRKGGGGGLTIGPRGTLFGGGFGSGGWGGGSWGGGSSGGGFGGFGGGGFGGGGSSGKW